jgi:hypothetical protein
MIFADNESKWFTAQIRPDSSILVRTWSAVAGRRQCLLLDESTVARSQRAG